MRARGPRLHSSSSRPGAPELTLTDPAPNVFRFATDAAQFVAGLGAYAYDVLGWRKAADRRRRRPVLWGGAAGFIAEFCALGGRIVDRSWIPSGRTPAAAVPHALRADGVYLGPGRLARARLRRSATPPCTATSRERLVSSARLLFDPSVIALARGVVVAGSLPVEPTAAEAAYAAAFSKAFPAIPSAAAIDPTTRSRTVTESRRCWKRTSEAGRAAGAPLQTALARLAARLCRPAGSVSTRNRQAIGPNYLSRIATDAKGKPAVRTVRVGAERRADFRRLLQGRRAAAESDKPACVKRKPPPLGALISL